MDIHQLKTFVVVAREGSITRASELLHLSQPAVSAHIKTIEDTLELTLFECPGFGVVLFHALWIGEPQAINGFANLSGLIMAYMAARFGVLGVYVAGRSKEKRAAVASPGILGDVLSAVTRKR